MKSTVLLQPLSSPEVEGYYFDDNDEEKDEFERMFELPPGLAAMMAEAEESSAAAAPTLSSKTSTGEGVRYYAAYSKEEGGELCSSKSASKFESPCCIALAWFSP